MTAEHECTKGVVETRKFLQMLASAVDVTIRGLVQSVAEYLLRHHPLGVGLEASATALPGVWSHPPPGSAWNREAQSDCPATGLLRCTKTATHSFPHW